MRRSQKHLPSLILSPVVVAFMVLTFLFMMTVPQNDTIARDGLIEGNESKLEELLGEKFRVTQTKHFHLESFLGPTDAEKSAQLCEKAYDFCKKLFGLGSKDAGQGKEDRKTEKKSRDESKEKPESDDDEETPADEDEYETEEEEHYEDEEVVQEQTEFWEGRCEVFFIKSRQAYEKYVDIVFAGDDPTEIKMTKRVAGFYIYVPPRSVGCYENANQSLVALQHSAVHQVGHFCLYYFRTPTEVPLWLNEGFASFVESSVMGVVASRCIGGGTGGHDPHKWEDSNNWETLLKELIAKKKDTPISTLITRREFSSMTIPDRAKSWSLVKYMVKRDKEKFVKFIRALKDGSKQEDALKESYGLTFKELEDKWKRELFKKKKRR